MSKASEWEWYGHAAHFVCGRWCRFHMATKVGDYLVSTVGEYLHPRHGAGSEQAEAAYLRANGYETIGCDRKYETMVFALTGEVCTAKNCACGLPEIIPPKLDFLGYNDAGAARRGHMTLCKKWAKKKAK